MNFRRLREVLHVYAAVDVLIVVCQRCVRRQKRTLPLRIVHRNGVRISKHPQNLRARRAASQANVFAGTKIKAGVRYQHDNRLARPSGHCDVQIRAHQIGGRFGEYRRAAAAGR